MAFSSKLIFVVLLISAADENDIHERITLPQTEALSPCSPTLFPNKNAAVSKYSKRIDSIKKQISTFIVGLVAGMGLCCPCNMHSYSHPEVQFNLEIKGSFSAVISPHQYTVQPQDLMARTRSACRSNTSFSRNLCSPQSFENQYPAVPQCPLLQQPRLHHQNQATVNQ